MVRGRAGPQIRSQREFTAAAPQLKHNTFATRGRAGGIFNVATLALHGDATTDVVDGLVLFDAVFMSTRYRIERCCAAPFFFGARIGTQDPKAEPVDHQTTRDAIMYVRNTIY
jgi:hypothetical protein